MNKAVFLDRDGVINDYVRHVNSPDDLFLFEDVGKAIKRLNDNDYKVFVVTNQGGIGLGFMSEEALHNIHERLIDEISDDGASIEEIAYCPHSPRAACECRKPSPKMITDLAHKHDVDIDRSFMVGDRETDIIAGEKAGTKTIFIGDEPLPKADYSTPTLVKAVDWILKQEKELSQ